MKLEKELKTKPIKNPHDRAILNIMFTGNWLLDHVNKTLKPWKISEPQYNVLRILKGQNGNSMNLYMIQERMIHRMSNATRLVDKLYQKGLVSREQCDRDRRMVNISITKRGLNLITQVRKAMLSNRAKLTKALSKNDAMLIGDLLDQMRE